MDDQNTPKKDIENEAQVPEEQKVEKQLEIMEDEVAEDKVEKPAIEKTKSEKATDDVKPVEVTPEPAIDVPSNARWYVVHTYSGHENKVSATLKQRIETMKLQSKIFEIVVPTRNIVTVKHGKKEEQKEKIFPGYILVKMVLDDESWLAVRTTQGVTAFVGAGNKPTPISDKEVQTILKFMEQEAPKYKTKFSVNEAVKIVDGPFADFLGTIDSIDEEKGKVKVLVSIFGRETPVELDFLQVAKL